MLGTFESINLVDPLSGNPTGGFVQGVGLSIFWQRGPLGRGPERQDPNGAFVETVIAAAKQRLEFYQVANNGRFWCEEHAAAIENLARALEFLDSRTKRREVAQVEGTHAPEVRP